MNLVSITTGAVQIGKDVQGLRELKDCIEIYGQTGYRTLDLGFCHHEEPDYILAGDDWEKKIDELGETAARYGIEFYQSHIPFAKGGVFLKAPYFQKEGNRERFRLFTERAYQASCRLGVKWAVLHPGNYPEFNFDTEASRRANRDYYDRFVELGIRGGCGTAWENMLPKLDRSVADVYCSHIEQLIDLVDSYGDPMVGICWDTGHANQMSYDQAAAIRRLGSRLKALHLNDNTFGNRDEHLLPFMGTVDWEQVLEALVEVDYAGSLNFETHQMCVNAEGQFQLDLLKLCFSCNQYFEKRFLQEKCRQGKL